MLAANARVCLDRSGILQVKNGFNPSVLHSTGELIAVFWFTMSTTPRVSKRLTAGEMNSSFKQALEIPRAFLLYVFSLLLLALIHCVQRLTNYQVVIGNKVDVEENKRMISSKRAMTFSQS